MKCIIFASLLGVMAATQAHADDLDEMDSVLPYHCDDRVVVGRVQSAGYDLIPDEDDNVGHGVIGATIAIRKVVKGRSLPKVLTASYVAHASLRPDQDFMLILREEPDGAFWITSEQLLSAHPKLAAQCIS